jgi:D-3-phosphoglycerate dehydrogenase / 2-oxoglutarate reductase
MAELVRGCAALIVGLDPVTERVLDAGPLRAVVKYGSGLDNIDVVAACRRGVEVASTPLANSTAVAELTVGLMFCVARHIVWHDHTIKAGHWARRTGMELAGRCLGVVGYGSVGREVGRLARSLGMSVVAHDPYIEEADALLVTLEDLLSRADVVSLHVPLSDESRGLIDDRAIARMNPGTLLINTARRGLVDEHALGRALRDGRLAGAACDVFDEGAQDDANLLVIETFVASPHAGATTVESIERMGVAAVEEVLRLLGSEREGGADHEGDDL